jgi:hypothetical protein
MKQKLLCDLHKSNVGETKTLTGHALDAQPLAEISNATEISNAKDIELSLSITEAGNLESTESTITKTENSIDRDNSEEKQKQCKQNQSHKQKNATMKVVAETGKCKRKRTSLIECNQLFAAVQEHVQVDVDQLPHLMHTPHSLFRLLCQSFEKQFPNCLAQTSVDEILLSLENKI